MENVLRIRWISLALFAHKQSWSRATRLLAVPLAPCAVLFVTLALGTWELALVAITVASRWILVDLIISQSTSCEALGFGCIQHLMSRCTLNTSLVIAF